MFLNTRFSIVLLIVGLILVSEVACKDDPPKWFLKIFENITKVLEKLYPGKSDEIVEKLTAIIKEWTKKIKAENAKQHKGLLSSN
ncbi:hypothetical protein AVEN_264553-1 [Araneus ventricosus]|uniref:Uncharacterized protein n=1 Tax=Araneus ventricosus TaxID=182803 RepID=A0A4Y2KWL3_ARAVE|nr:hypothetical protein AVEN_264553-1 [Araneus ventricosus]